MGEAKLCRVNMFGTLPSGSFIWIKKTCWKVTPSSAKWVKIIAGRLGATSSSPLCGGALALAIPERNVPTGGSAGARPLLIDECAIRGTNEDSDSILPAVHTVQSHNTRLEAEGWFYTYSTPKKRGTFGRIAVFLPNYWLFLRYQ